MFLCLNCEESALDTQLLVEQESNAGNVSNMRHNLNYPCYFKSSVSESDHTDFKGGSYKGAELFDARV